MENKFHNSSVEPLWQRFNSSPISRDPRFHTSLAILILLEKYDPWSTNGAQ
jgi:hypothetical protein